MSLPGKILYHGWHRPLGALRASINEGGPLQARRTEQGRVAMEKAALNLPQPAPATGAPLELHLLTGQRFWYQTAFCLWTMARHAERSLAPVIYDDGTLTEENRHAISRLFSATRFISREEALAKLDQHLPSTRFPVLRERWQNYPNIRKITDPHLGGAGWKLVIDSDLLFFRRPAFLIDWLDRPKRPLHAVDCKTSYGYSRALMNELAGRPVSDLVNVGLAGLDSHEIDWERLERWCQTLIARERTSYYLEQALVSMLLAGRDCAIAPSGDYVTKPTPPETGNCRAVMHHYVANSKRWYFQQCWQTARAK